MTETEYIIKRVKSDMFSPDELQEIATAISTKLVHKRQPMERIYAVVSEYAKFDIKQKSRRRDISWMRQSAQYVMRLHGYSSLSIGEMLGYDHSTVLYSLKAVSDRMSVDPDYRNEVNNIVNLVNMA